MTIIDSRGPYATHASLSNVKFDEYGAAAIYRLMQSIGATKDTVLFLDGRGRISVHSKFHYESGLMPTDDDDGKRIGDMTETLDAWVKKRARLHRLNVRKMNKIQGALSRVGTAFDWLKKELHS